MKKNFLGLRNHIYFWFRLLQYSPSKGTIYVRYKDDRRELGWKTTAEWSKSLEGIYEEKDPEVGHSDEFYKLCETFADQFTRTEDEQFVFLDLKATQQITMMLSLHFDRRS